ncbi:MAG: GNAT family N-acetyltransferase [Acidimicrobiales bacterium]
MSRSVLRLRPLRSDDEAEFLAGHRTMLATDGWSFALGLDESVSWNDYIARLSDIRRGINLPAGIVPAAFLVAEVDGRIVGRTSIRFELNDWLARQGGHIGYGVLPDHRRLGHATEILRQSLVIARSEGVERSLLCCDDTNTASATVIERCGGQLESVVDGDGGPVRRYWLR